MKLYKVVYTRVIAREELVAAESLDDARQKAMRIPEEARDQFWFDWEDLKPDPEVNRIDLIRKESEIPGDWEVAVPWGLPDDDRRYCIDFVEPEGE